MEFPTIIKWTSSFPFWGFLSAIFHFYSNLIEDSVSKQWWSWLDAEFCDVWSGSALFAYVPQKKTLGLNGLSE